MSAACCTKSATVHLYSPLYRCTVLTVTAQDLSSRARIVDSAMTCFAERGYRSATVREIASRAGVSAALVTHHFGGKEQLRRECDRRVVDFVREKQDAAADSAAVLDAAVSQYGPYLATMLSTSDTGGSELFARLRSVAESTVHAMVAEGRMHASADPEAQATMLVVLAVAPFLLAQRLTEWAGDEGIGRIAVPLTELYERGLFADPPPAATTESSTEGDR